MNFERLVSELGMDEDNNMDGEAKIHLEIVRPQK